MSFYPDTDEGVPTTAPFRRRVGHEVEINGGTLANNLDFAKYLWDHGYGTPKRGRGYDYRYTNGLHNYHCRCQQANQFGVHTTYDGTAAGGEHIIGGTKGVLFGSPAYMEAIGMIAEAADATGGRGENGTGGHIHVSSKGLGKVKTVHLFRNLTVLWGQILELASGSWDEVRRNGNMTPPLPGNPLVTVTAANPDFGNVPPMPRYPEERIRVRVPVREEVRFDAGGYWNTTPQATFSSRYVTEPNPNYYAEREAYNDWHRDYARVQRVMETDLWECNPRDVVNIMSLSNAFRFRYVNRMPKTIEFRVWNTTVSRWRLYMGAGVSAALVEAAAQNRKLTQEDDTDLLDHLDGLLTADLVALVERQRAILRGDFSMAA